MKSFANHRESETSTSERVQQSAAIGQQGPEQTRYRIASVGQDCQLLLWDFVVEEGDYKDSLDLSQPRQPLAASLHCNPWISKHIEGI